MKFADFFKKAGNVVKKILGVIESIVPDEQMLAAVAFVEAAAERFADNTERRQWVQGKLQARFPGMSDTLATVITHLALLAIKKEVKALSEKAVKQIEGA